MVLSSMILCLGGGLFGACSVFVVVVVVVVVVEFFPSLFLLLFFRNQKLTPARKAMCLSANCLGRSARPQAGSFLLCNQRPNQQPATYPY